MTGDNHVGPRQTSRERKFFAHSELPSAGSGPLTIQQTKSVKKPLPMPPSTLSGPQPATYNIRNPSPDTIPLPRKYDERRQIHQALGYMLTADPTSAVNKRSSASVFKS